jgi:hypothetical protein
MGEFYTRLGKNKSSRIRLAVIDMWRPFRLAMARERAWDLAHAELADVKSDLTIGPGMVWL